MDKIIMGITSGVHFDKIDPMEDFNRIYLYSHKLNGGRVVIRWSCKFALIDREKFVTSSFYEKLEELLEYYISEFDSTPYLCETSEEAWNKMLED